MNGNTIAGGDDGHNDDVVHVLGTEPPLNVSGINRKAYKRDNAVLYAHTKNPGPYALHFVD